MFAYEFQAKQHPKLCAEQLLHDYAVIYNLDKALKQMQLCSCALVTRLHSAACTMYARGSFLLDKQACKLC